MADNVYALLQQAWSVSKGSDANMYGVEVAIVTNVKDPEKQGRVKICFPRLPGKPESDWARVMQPAAGSGRGFYWLPEVSDEVLVAFERGQANLPFVIGALWNGKDKPMKDAYTDDNTRRMIQTKSGHQILFEDKSGDEKISIADKSGKRTLTFDVKDKKFLIEAKEGDVEIHSKKKLVLQCEDLEIKTTKTGKIKIGTRFDLKVADKASFKAGPKMDIKAGKVNLNPPSLSIEALVTAAEAAVQAAAAAAAAAAQQQQQQAAAAAAPAPAGPATVPTSTPAAGGAAAAGAAGGGAAAAQASQKKGAGAPAGAAWTKASARGAAAATSAAATPHGTGTAATRAPLQGGGGHTKERVDPQQKRGGASEKAAAKPDEKWREEIERVIAYLQTERSRLRGRMQQRFVDKRMSEDSALNEHLAAVVATALFPELPERPLRAALFAIRGGKAADPHASPGSSAEQKEARKLWGELYEAAEQAAERASDVHEALSWAARADEWFIHVAPKINLAKSDEEIGRILTSESELAGAGRVFEAVGTGLQILGVFAFAVSIFSESVEQGDRFDQGKRYGRCLWSGFGWNLTPNVDYRRLGEVGKTIHALVKTRNSDLAGAKWLRKSIGELLAYSSDDARRPERIESMTNFMRAVIEGIGYEVSDKGVEAGWKSTLDDRKQRDQLSLAWSGSEKPPQPQPQAEKDRVRLLHSKLKTIRDMTFGRLTERFVAAKATEEQAKWEAGCLLRDQPSEDQVRALLNQAKAKPKTEAVLDRILEGDPEALLDAAQAGTDVIELTGLWEVAVGATAGAALGVAFGIAEFFLFSIKTLQQAASSGERYRAADDLASAFASGLFGNEIGIDEIGNDVSICPDEDRYALYMAGRQFYRELTQPKLPEAHVGAAFREALVRMIHEPNDLSLHAKGVSEFVDPICVGLGVINENDAVMKSVLYEVSNHTADKRARFPKKP